MPLSEDRDTQPDVALSAKVRHTSTRGMVYERRGSGPVVLFVHGWCLNRHLWMYQQQALLAQSTVVTVDLAGFGESMELAGPYSVLRHAQDVAALLSELDIRPAVVVGFAYGAMVAIELARIAPDYVDELMVIGVPSAATAPYGRMARSMIRDWPDFAARSISSICAKELSPASRDWLVAMYSGTPLPVALAVLGELEVWEPLPLVESLPQRTTVVTGSEDSIVPPSVAKSIVAAMANAHLETVPGAGHLVPIDAKTELTDLIVTALANRSGVEASHD